MNGLHWSFYYKLTEGRVVQISLPYERDFKVSRGEKKKVSAQTKWPTDTVLAVKTAWKIRYGRDQKSTTQSWHTRNQG